MSPHEMWDTYTALAHGGWLFLWEGYSPDYGFRMPWLQL